MPDLPFNAAPVPATPIGDLKDWQLHIQCGRRWRHVVLHLDSLAEGHGHRMRVAEVVRRLRRISRRRAMPRNPEAGDPGAGGYGKTAQKLPEIVVVPSELPLGRVRSNAMRIAP
jgi:hypothetical protein